MNKVFIALILVFIGLALRGYVFANNDTCFCHNVNNNPHTICTSNQGQINGHMGHVNNGEDTLGECQVNVHSPTPSVTPVDPTATPEATITDTQRVTDTPVPTNTPIPTEGLTRSFTSDFTRDFSKPDPKPQGTDQVSQDGGDPSKGIWK